MIISDKIDAGQMFWMSEEVKNAKSNWKSQLKSSILKLHARIFPLFF